MKNALQIVAVLTIIAVAIFLMGTPSAQAGCGYFGYSTYCAPCYNHYTPIYPVHTCVPTYTPYFNPYFRAW